ncbi:hypothetical protein JOQ06_002044 [Pogonophryne albipinna]|uniref:DEK n=1 Tax=Pogonophryne albipinna TaxID=1090488 RepID=A0AAD6A4V6_9TELE|nr:hypothetical protein JOQ06_002044 [Pogonophryne albipinna]
MSVAADESLSEVEDQQEAAQEDKSSPNKSSSKISGKRAKKTVERLDFQAPKQKEKLKIGDGNGDKLGDIPRTCLQITKMKTADLKPLHTILFDRPGKTAILKKNLRLFNGFPFAADSEEFTKKREKLLKNSNFTNTKLKVVCGVLDLEKKGTHSDLVDRILTFLTEPKNSGKRLPASAKKSKLKIRSSSSSPKKTKAGSKSKAIVMDSSSDEDDEEEEEKAATTSADDEEEEKAAKESETEEKPSEEREDQSDKSEESEEEESPKSKPARGKSTPKKSAPVKRQRTPAKKTSPPKKRAKKEVSDESDADSEADEKVTLTMQSKTFFTVLLQRVTSCA